MTAIGWFRALVVDCDDPERLATFWQTVLGVDIAERQEEWVQLTPDPGGVYFAFQPWTASQADNLAGPDRASWVRPDIEVVDVEAAAAAIESLGGSRQRTVHEPDGDTHVVMADPEGNEFCILPPLPPDLARPRWGDSTVPTT
jgi:predicted enzyme related to lactoylglutathione lyase